MEQQFTQEELETIEAVLWRQMMRFRDGEYLDAEERQFRQSIVESTHRKIQRAQLQKTTRTP